MARFSSLFILLAFTISVTAPAYAQAGWSKAYPQSVVVSAEKHASRAGQQIIEQGGNAVDAAVAVQFALAVTLPRAGNIGGGGFMMIRLSDGTTRALDFRETAPLRSTSDMFNRGGEYMPHLSRQSILASGVPGVVDGMIRAIEHHGRLPLETVMAPAIELAEQGYRLSWSQADDLNRHADSFREYESSRSYFTQPGELPYREGDLFVQKDLAETLQRIARFGRGGFYSGRTANMIVSEMQKHGGIISHRDLQQYESKWRDPVTVEFRGYRLHMMPPPSSGGVAIGQILGMMEPFEPDTLGYNTPRYLHLLTETMRRAFADRAQYLGDPDFSDLPVTSLLSPSYLRHRMSTYHSLRASNSDSVGPGKMPSGESLQTTHFSVVDAEGNAVAVTTTLNGSFGNHISVGGAGFLLNNEMDDFTAEPGFPNMFGLIQGEANAIEPGKRMLSSMSPTVVTRDGRVRMVLGAAGGPRIITATLQNFLNIALFGMNAQQAVSAPRIHHQWLPDRLYYEAFGIPLHTRRQLRQRGHFLREEQALGRSHLIFIDEEGIRYGAPDPRGDGYAAGK